VAETAVRQAEDRLRLLIFDATRRDVWSVPLEPSDAPPVGVAALDVESAVTRALQRTDLRQLRGVSAQPTLPKAGRQSKTPGYPGERSYQASGLGGTEVLRAGGFQERLSVRIDHTVRISARSAVQSNYPTWAVGLSVSPDRRKRQRRQLRAGPTRSHAG
jgi:hypothetical protein